MSEIPREPRTYAPSSPLLRPPPPGSLSTLTPADPTGPIAAAVRTRAWDTVRELLQDLADRPDALPPRSVTVLEALTSTTDLPLEIHGRLQVALGRQHERSGDLEAAESAYEVAYGIDPSDETLLLLTRLRRKVRGSAAARELLWPHLDFEPDRPRCSTRPRAWPWTRSRSTTRPCRWPPTCWTSRITTTRSRRASGRSGHATCCSASGMRRPSSCRGGWCRRCPPPDRVQLAEGLPAGRLDTAPGRVDAVCRSPDEPWALALFADLLLIADRLEGPTGSDPHPGARPGRSVVDAPGSRSGAGPEPAVRRRGRRLRCGGGHRVRRLVDPDAG